eukprot:1980016-Pleurochrysis_carterae.AAC.1
MECVPLLAHEQEEGVKLYLVGAALERAPASHDASSDEQRGAPITFGLFRAPIYCVHPARRPCRPVCGRQRL